MLFTVVEHLVAAWQVHAGFASQLQLSNCAVSCLPRDSWILHLYEHQRRATN